MRMRVEVRLVVIFHLWNARYLAAGCPIEGLDHPYGETLILNFPYFFYTLTKKVVKFIARR